MGQRPEGDHEEVGELTEEQVRRLLAASAGSPAEEMPQDVAGRLDEVLADVVRQRGTHPLEPPDSGRRRRGPRLLLAAAAVCVLALGVGVGVRDVTSGPQHAESTADSAGGAAQPQRSIAPGPAQDQGSSALSRDGQPPRVRARSLRADLRRVAASGLAVPVAHSRRWRSACVRPETGSGDEWLPVRFDGRPAVLVLRAPAHGRRTADVYTCGSADAPAASATLDAR